MLPIAVFANIYHHSSEPVKDKTKLKYIFGVVFVFGAVAYSSIGERGEVKRRSE